MAQDRPPHLVVPDLGVGLGLRIPHYGHLLSGTERVGFLEIISENFLGVGGKPRRHLAQALETHPVVLHGVSLSIGSPDTLDWEYLRRLKELVRLVQPAWVSDHFSFGGTASASVHELLPLPYTFEVLERVGERARQIQDYLECPFALENTSSYLSYRVSQMQEWEFIAEVLERANCGLLLDVNNIYVSAFNHGYSPMSFLKGLPLERTLEIHLAGHSHYGKYILDTHRGPPIAPVLRLYQEALALTGPVSTLLEWDDEIPTFSTVKLELERISRARERALAAPLEPLTPLPLEVTPDHSTPTKKVGGGTEQFIEPPAADLSGEK